MFQSMPDVDSQIRDDDINEKNTQPTAKYGELVHASTCTMF